MRTCMLSSSSRLIDRSAAVGPRRVRIEVHHDPLRVPLQSLNLLRRQRRAATRHHGREARRRDADRIHVAFHQDDPVLFADRLLGPMQVVKHVALLIYRRFRRIQVLGIILGRQRAPAKTDDLARFVVDGKHQAVAEAVVKAAVVALAHQPGLLQLVAP